MNKGNKLTIDLLTAANEKYRATLAKICEDFCKQRDSAKQNAQKYKDEREIFRNSMVSIIQDARKRIHTAQAELADVYTKQADKLEDSLQESLSHALNLGFVQRLEFYRSMGLKPSKSEIETLVTLASGHLTALAGIDHILDVNGSGYRLKYTKVEDLEKDLDAVRDFAKLIPHAGTPEQLGTLNEILGDSGVTTTIKPRETNTHGMEQPGDELITSKITSGEPMRRLVSGRTFETGGVYNYTALLGEENNFSRMENRLSEMMIRWCDVTSPEIEESQASGENTEDEDKPEGEPETMIPSGTEIVDADREDRALKLARELAKEAAKWKEPVDLNSFVK